MTQHVTLTEAAAYVQDGMTVALGGMALNRRPVAFVRELLRRDVRPKNLTLLSFTAGYAADLLVGAGCVSAVRTVYFGLEAFGFAPMFTEFANRGALHVIEETETSLVLGLRARAAGVGFMPSRAWQGTDLLGVRPDVQSLQDPYTGDTLTAFPSVGVDVAVLHALEVDDEGNAAINNNLGIDQLLTYAADTVIVTAERRVSKIEPMTHKTIIPAAAVDVVSVAERGAYPTSCYPDYALSGRVFMDYSEACAAGEFEAYLARFVAGEV